MGRLSEEIEELILDGELAAGEKLYEQTLAKRFHVSRTPVREALHELASTGLVKLVPNRGAFVATLTLDQSRELFAAMAELEASCARLAAISMTPQERQSFQRIHDRMGAIAKDEKLHEFGEMNDAFHAAIYKGAHNRYLEQMAKQTRRRLALYVRTQFRLPGRLVRSYEEHASIVRSVICGDHLAAHAAMRHHVDQVEESAEHIISEWNID
ncbi:GntR family transcriptional regulator [Altererythrobacter sp. GH1-8]|uniref:GntR family transcriptional regulator n=1 Tax=Altererythrobacter sp. GH1-8 TaxID=3349333 RepID=UPI00374DB85B